MKIAIIHNPKAGEDDGGAEELREAWEAAGHDVAYRSSKEDRWDEVLGCSLDLLVVAGGDGTVAKVLLALAEAPGELAKSLDVAVAPMGTANNIATSLGLPAAVPSGFLDEVARGRRRTYDLPLAASGGRSSRFVESFGGGLFAGLLAEAVARQERGVSDKTVGSALDLLSELLDRAATQPWGVTVDGRDLSGAYVAVEVLNVGHVGPNVALAPEADPGDGLVDVVLVGAQDVEAIASNIDARRRDEPAPALELARHRAPSVEVTVPLGVELHVDDRILSSDPQILGREPRTVTVRTDGRGIRRLTVPK